MAANKKLTPVLKGRTVKSVTPTEKGVAVSFHDGSRMAVKTPEPPQGDLLLNRTVDKVRQSGTVMNLDFKDGSSAEIKLAEATSSVMLRDKDDNMEYAD